MQIQLQEKLLMFLTYPIQFNNSQIQPTYRSPKNISVYKTTRSKHEFQKFHAQKMNWKK
jgi:hypothetical protein